MLNINEIDSDGLKKVEKFISVLTPGYIVLSNELIIGIREDQDHNEACSLCLHHLGENPEYKKYEFLDAVKALNSLGHLVYLGTTWRNIRNGGLEIGFLCEPNVLTEFQEEFIEKLLKTNKSNFSDKEVLIIEKPSLCVENNKQKIMQYNN